MGRPAKKIDTEAMLDLLEKGFTQKEASVELGISIPTLSRRIAEIQSKQGILLKYRAIQALQLTELQARVLEAITPEKIADATLKDLVLSYKILKDKECVLDGKPSDIKGLVRYLVELEKRDTVLAEPIDVTEEENDEPFARYTQ